MPIRVLHAVASLEPEAGSVAVALPGLFQSLRRGDVQSIVVTLDTDPPPCPDADVVRFEAGDADRLIVSSDVLHVHGLDLPLACPLVRAARRRKVPYVIAPLGACRPDPWENGRWYDRLRRRRAGRAILSGARTIVAVNEAEAGDLGARKLAGRTEVLGYGLDFGAFEPPERAARPPGAVDRSPSILMLGPIHPAEGLVPLLRAVAELGRVMKGWRVVLAGPDCGGWLDQIRAAVERKGGGDRVAFEVNPDPAAQRRLLGRASLVAAPALRVRCPIGVEQALAAGVPVVASARGLPGGMESCVRVCEPTRDGLRDALRDVVGREDGEIAALTARARQRGRCLFDWEVLGPKYIGMYRSAIGSG